MAYDSQPRIRLMLAAPDDHASVRRSPDVTMWIVMIGVRHWAL